MQKQSRGIDLFVLVSGIGTSFAALVLVFVLSAVGFDPMTFYIFFIVPVGALLVGLLAGSGYALMSWIRNSFVHFRSKVIIFVLGALTYVLAHYITYMALLAANDVPSEAFSFFDYIRLLCENISYGDIHDDEGVALGKFGYLIQLVEWAGFAFGGIIPLLILQTIPYCHHCQRYKKPLLNVFINSEETKALLKKQKKAAKTQIIEDAVAKLVALSEPLLGQMETSSLQENIQLLENEPRKVAKDSIANLNIKLQKCPNCDEHTVRAFLQNVTVDGKANINEIRKMDVPAVQPTAPTQIQPGDA
jgi:hypothetical protein